MGAVENRWATANYLPPNAEEKSHLQEVQYNSGMASLEDTDFFSFPSIFQSLSKLLIMPDAYISYRQCFSPGWFFPYQCRFWNHDAISANERNAISLWFEIILNFCYRQGLRVRCTMTNSVPVFTMDMSQRPQIIRIPCPVLEHRHLIIYGEILPCESCLQPTETLCGFRKAAPV